VLLIFSLEIHFPFLPFLLPSKPSVISSKAPLGFFRFHSISCIVDLASWILVHAQFYLSTHGHNISHHFLPGLKFSVSSSAPAKAEHARDFVRFDTTQKIFSGVWISVPAADFSLLLVFSLAGFISLCGARFALLFFAVVTLQVQQRLLLLVLSALATQFAFGSLSHCSAACSRFLHPCLLLYSIFATTAVSQDCLVSASCCSARFRLQVKILIAWIVAG
jgi:hypothetical protein